MSGRLLRWLLLGVLGGVALGAAAGAGEPSRAAPAVTPYRDLRYEGVIAQTDWYTCGPAAAATLLRYYFGLDVDESDVLEASAAAGGLDPSAGVSALALVRSLGAFGVPAQGYRLTPEALADYFRRGGLPVIAHATRPRQHYVVVVGLVGDYALVADPSWGRRVERWVDFAADKGFSGVVLVPVPEAGLAAAAADAQRLALAGAARDLRRLDRLGAEVGRR